MILRISNEFLSVGMEKERGTLIRVNFEHWKNRKSKKRKDCLKFIDSNLVLKIRHVSHGLNSDQWKRERKARELVT